MWDVGARASEAVRFRSERRGAPCRINMIEPSTGLILSIVQHARAEVMGSS